VAYSFPRDVLVGPWANKKKMAQPGTRTPRRVTGRPPLPSSVSYSPAGRIYDAGPWPLVAMNAGTGNYSPPLDHQAEIHDSREWPNSLQGRHQRAWELGLERSAGGCADHINFPPKERNCSPPVPGMPIRRSWPSLKSTGRQVPAKPRGHRRESRSSAPGGFTGGGSRSTINSARGATDIRCAMSLEIC